MEKIKLSDKAGFVILGGVATQISILVTSIFLARLYSQEIFGSYKQLFLIYDILAPLFLLTIPVSLLYFIPRLETTEDRKRFVWQTVFLLFGLGFAASLSLFFAADFLSNRFGNDQLKNLIQLFSPYLFFVVSAAYFNQLMIATGKVRLLTVLTLIFTIVSSVPVIIAAILGVGIKQIIFVNIMSSLIIFVVSLLLTIKIFGFSFKPKLNWLFEQIRYSLPLALSNFIGKFSWQIDRLIVSIFFATSTFAVYAVGALEVPIVGLVNGAVAAVLIPEIARLHKEGSFTEIVGVWHRAMRRQSLVVFPSFVYLMFMAEPLISILFSDTYLDSVTYFRIYQLLLPLRIATYGLIFQATGMTRLNFAGGIFFLIVNAIANGILVRTIGLPGPAIATVTATFLLAIFYIFNLVKRLPVFNVNNVLPWGILAKNLVFSCLIGISLIPFLYADIPKIVLLALSALTYSLLYLIIGLRLNIFSSGDLALIKRWVSFRFLKK